MAVTKRIFSVCKHHFNDPSKKIAELGAQYVMEGDWGGYGPPYFRDIFSNLNIRTFDYIIENNCEFLDLSKNIPISIKNEFDIVTNFGTSEHVQNQFICWNNIFDMVNKNGIVINVVPKKGNWPNHCKYYFDEYTFESMNLDFDIIEMSDIVYEDNGALIYCVLRKKHDGLFKTKEENLIQSIQIIENYKDKIGY